MWKFIMLLWGYLYNNIFTHTHTHITNWKTQWASVWDPSFLSLGLLMLLLSWWSHERDWGGLQVVWLPPPRTPTLLIPPQHQKHRPALVYISISIIMFKTYMFCHLNTVFKHIIIVNLNLSTLYILYDPFILSYPPILWI